MSHKCLYSVILSTGFPGFILLASLLHAQQDRPKLVDTTQKAGIAFVHNFGDDEMSNLVESNAAGCAFFDYDGDGDLDIYLVNGAYIEGISHVRGRRNRGRLSNALYRNNGNSTFTDVTAEAGVGHKGMGMAVVTADYDNDGDQDLFVSNYGPNVFYRNNGDGTFTDITIEAGLENNLYGIGSTFLDYDQDGFLDLYVGNYIEYDPDYQYFYAANRFPGPLAYHGQPDLLYHNNGDGTFTDVTRQAGVYQPEGRAMGVTSCDLDNDGDWDIFVSNDAMENYLYRNNGDGTFTDIALQTATGFGQSGEATSAMSGEFGDIDLDGFVDIIVPDLAYSCLYKNTGAGYFEEMSARMGLAAACGQYTSWSGNFFDFDHDGFGDLFISNGHPHRLIGQEDLLLINNSGNGFINVSHELGADFQDKFVGRGSATGDFDDDGDMDLLVLNLNDRLRLLRNDGGNKKNWIMIHLIGTQSNRNAIGSRIRLTTGEKVQTRWRVSSSGYLSQSDYRIHFGLGDYTQVDQIEVLWPSGNVQTLKDVEANQVITVKEPAR
ncbi:MAG: CRTAC1 family protein [Fidelibacterota bacterium]|nr:MAG: CRTAC1 family protein [Candidatus Neomarinimicrobiota bacterium]